MLTEHPLLSEPSSVSFYNWMSNAVGNRSGAGLQDSPVNRSQHNSMQTGQTAQASYRLFPAPLMFTSVESPLDWMDAEFSVLILI